MDEIEVKSRVELEEYLLGKIGDPVKFTYPEGDGPLKGRLFDGCAIFDREDDSVVYWNMIGLIKYVGEDEDWLRITYYRYKKRESRWIFAGQTSVSDPISDFIKLFVKAIRQKEWIRSIFREVCKELSKVT